MDNFIVNQDPILDKILSEHQKLLYASIRWFWEQLKDEDEKALDMGDLAQ